MNGNAKPLLTAGTRRGHDVRGKRPPRRGTGTRISTRDTTHNTTHPPTRTHTHIGVCHLINHANMQAATAGKQERFDGAPFTRGEALRSALRRPTFPSPCTCAQPSRVE